MVRTRNTGLYGGRVGRGLFSMTDGEGELVFPKLLKKFEGKEDDVKFDTGVKFLDEIVERIPSMKYLIEESHINLLKVDGSLPFKDDEEFFDYEIMKYKISDMILDAQSTLTEAHLDPDTTGKFPSTVSQVMLGLSELFDHIKEVSDLRLAVSKVCGKTPRVLRFAEAAQMTETEARIVIICVASVLEYVHASLDTSTVSSYLKVSQDEMLVFLNPKRKYNSDGLFQMVDSMNILQSQLRLQNQYQQALAGGKLSSDYILQLHGTILADVLAAEGGEYVQANVKAEEPELPPMETGEAEVKPPLERLDSFQLYDFIKQERQQEELAKAIKADQLEVEVEEEEEEEVLAEHHSEEGAGVGVPDKLDGEEAITPYKTEIEYLEDNFRLVASKMAIAQLQLNIRRAKGGLLYQYDDPMQEKNLREQQGKERMFLSKIQRRLALTKETGSWMPRLERFVKGQRLDATEKLILLIVIGYSISEDVKQVVQQGFAGACTVAAILQVLGDSLEEEIKYRKYFYKSSPLVKGGVIRVQMSLGDDLNNSALQIDRRMLDFVMGLESEFSELVEGSHLYFPKVKMENVILPDEPKKLILDTFTSFESYKAAKKVYGFDEILSYGTGMVILFYGGSGTGKTMMANAVANMLGKKVLLINFPSLGRNNADEVMKMIFREARLNDAIVFFDECEAIFEARGGGNYDVNLLLTELERHDGLTIMATNRPFDLDEAMHRRITLAIEFRQPDPLLREKIWSLMLPKSLKQSADVDLKALSLKWELSGGFIKNAVMTALSAACARRGLSEEEIKSKKEKDAKTEAEDIIITMEDLEAGARNQLRGRLRMVDFYRRVVPSSGIERLILPESTLDMLTELINYEKSRTVMFCQWGFDELVSRDQGASALFHGIPGVGKTMAAESVGFELGKTLKVVNSSELISKYVGDTGKNIDSVFEEARIQDAVLVFDEAEGLFGHRHGGQTATDRYANVDVGLLLYHMERYPGVVILTTNRTDVIDKAFMRRLKFVVEFTMPTHAMRLKIWRNLLSSKVPLSSDVNLSDLAQKYEFAGGSIKSALFRACSRAALRPVETRRVTMDDFVSACEHEVRKSL